MVYNWADILIETRNEHTFARVNNIALPSLLPTPSIQLTNSIATMTPTANHWTTNPHYT